MSVRVTNQRGDLAHFLLLEDVGLRPDPRHNGLGMQRDGPPFTSSQFSVLKIPQHASLCVAADFACAAFSLSPHLSEVKDEAVSFVEAAPGQVHLLGTDVALPFDLVQPLHRPGALRPPEARIHAAVL